MLTAVALALAAAAQAAPPASPPSPAPQRNYIYSYFSADDYPASARHRHEEGIVRFAITVGRDGRVTDCRIVESSGVASLDAATCRIVRERVRYAPARDGNGQPIETDDGPFSITWRLP